MKFLKFKALFLAGSLVLAVAACGKPSVAGSESRYKTAKDKVSVLITKQPGNKAELEKKVAEFEKEYEAAMKAGSDEEKIKKLDDLSSRMEKYIGELEKAAPAPAGGAGAPSGKLDGGAGAPPAGGTAPAGGGGKLGGGTAAPPASGGMGGGTAAPASGMGGGTAAPPAGGTAPAQPASGGMGGM
jgi:hypothetical protein